MDRGIWQTIVRRELGMTEVTWHAEYFGYVCAQVCLTLWAESLSQAVHVPFCLWLQSARGQAPQDGFCVSPDACPGVKSLQVAALLML